MNTIKSKVITILGPTAIGKSDLAVDIALFLKEQNIDSEIISADSRQIYKRLDLGTGKITKEEMKNIPHHMLDVKNPNEEYSVFEYTNDANKIIEDLLSKNIIPIICGGTGLYIDALIFGNVGARAEVNQELRDTLEKKDLKYLQDELKNLAKKYNANITNIDIPNKRRVIRAIEILTELKNIPQKIYEEKYDNFIIGLDTDPEFLKSKVKIRLEKRLNAGMINEVENLLNQDRITHERLQKLGLEYKFISDYLTDTLTMEEFKEKLNIAICQYIKRQRTWFRKNKNIKDKIKWYDIQDKNYFQKIKESLKTFTSNNS
jgi:tRNA dimethylallyltransferase